MPPPDRWRAPSVAGRVPRKDLVMDMVQLEIVLILLAVFLASATRS